MTPLIELRHVSKRYWLRKNRSGELKVRFLGLLHSGRREIRDELWALRDVSFSVGRGEALGLIGRNGSGKSTLLKLVAGIHRPTEGRVLVTRGIQIGTLIELGIGFHPELSGRENVRLNAAIHGMTGAQIDAIYPGVVEYSGLRDFMDVQLKNYSSGMHMRLAFSVAANLNPDVLLLDEIFAVGDEEFQKQCRRTIEQFLADGKTILFVSHSSATVREVCSRVCLLEHGRLLFDGPVDEGFAAYQELMLTAPAPLGTEPAGPAPGPPDDPPRRFDFLRAQGLRRDDYVLEIRRGKSTGPLHEFLAPGRHIVRSPAAATELHGLPPIDVAVADAAFPELPPELMGPVVVSVLQSLGPDGRFFATYFEDRLLLAQLGAMARAGKGRVERIGDWGSPDAQMMVVFTRER
jgi:ABC-type polysaccharide/polyol phosphate transport system ATPase subunit